MKTNKKMERILVTNPYTGREIDVEPVLHFMANTFAGGQQYTEGLSTGHTAGKEIQNCMDFMAEVTVLANKEGWEQTDACMWSMLALTNLRKAFESMKEIK